MLSSKSYVLENNPVVVPLPRWVNFPRGVCIKSPDIVALARVTQESVGRNIRWHLDRRQDQLTGGGADSLEKALAETRGVRGVAFSGDKQDPENEWRVTGEVHAFFESTWARVRIGGLDLNWVAGSQQRLEDEISRRFTSPISWRWKGLIWIALWAFLVGGLAAWLLSVIGLQHFEWPAIPVLVAYSALMGAVGGAWFRRGTGTKLDVEPGSGARPHWYQHPYVETGKLVAMMIGAVWALVQLVRLATGHM